MKLSSYLSCSRHGVYYFRWPLDSGISAKRTTLRLSLKTKCPVHAGKLARFLSSCGQLVNESSDFSQMRLDEIRAIVKRYFEDALADCTDKLNASGLSDRQRQLIADEIGILKSGEEQQNN